MLTPNAGCFVPTLCVLLPLLTLPFLLAQEANMTNITTDQTQNTTLEMAQTSPAPIYAGFSPSMAVAKQVPQPTVVLTTIEEPFTRGLGIQSQGLEEYSTTTVPAAIQRSNKPTEAETRTASSWNPTSPLPESTTLPALTDSTEDVLGLSTRVESMMIAERTTEATAPTAITTTATTGLATATRSSAITPSSESLPSATPSASEPLGEEAAFTTTSSGTFSPAPAAPTLPAATSLPPPLEAFTPTKPDYDRVSSTGPTQPRHHLTTHPVVIGPKQKQQESDALWVTLVVLLVVAICVGGAVCCGLLVKRRRRRSQVLHLGSHGYRKNKGKEGEAWAGPVTMRGGVATDTAREECEGEAKENAEEKSKDRCEDGMLLSTFAVEGKGRASPDGQGVIGGTGSKEARKWEDESPLLYIDEDKVEVDTKVGATHLEGGGGGGIGEKVIGEETAKGKEEKEEEKDGKGLNENEERNGGKAFSYITSV